MRKIVSGLALLTATLGLSSCGEDGLTNPLDKNPLANELLQQCGLDCKGVIESRGSLSGDAKLDAFFTAVVSFDAQARLIEADIEAALREMALAAGAEVEAGADIKDLSAAIEAQVKGGFDGKIDGGLELVYEPPRCAVSAQATLEAAARCDASVDPGKASVECKGECVAEVEAMASCEGELKCTGKAPSFACEGECTGSCELDVGATCEGTCNGVCKLDGTAACDGECKGTLTDGMCDGECDVRAGGTCSGTCEGSCELAAGGTCEGKCKGECTWDPGEAECQGRASCEASGSASVECKGECKGEVEPPKVDAECEASVKAEANMKAECHPPKVDLKYELNADGELYGDVDAQAEFAAQMEAFAKAYGKLVAKMGKLEMVLSAGGELRDAAETTISSAAEAIVDGDANWGAKAGAYCAVSQAGPTASLLASAAQRLNGSLQVVVELTGAVASKNG